MHIDLDILTPEHLLGKWEVKKRFSSISSKKDPFSTVKSFEIGKGSFTADNGRRINGKYLLIRENEIIYNPQLKFYFRSQEIGNAIITRFYLGTEDDREVHKLTLYFTNGLELILHKN